MIALFAVVFYRAAAYEHMSAPVWAMASIAVSVLVMLGMGRGILLVILAQAVLFIVMTWRNATRRR